MGKPSYRDLLFNLCRTGALSFCKSYGAHLGIHHLHKDGGVLKKSYVYEDTHLNHRIHTQISITTSPANSTILTSHF